MELGRRDDASSASIGLAIAAATVAASFVVANLMVGPPSTVDSRSASLSLEAASALELIMRDPGRTLSGGDWGATPDDMTRFGLTLSGAPNFLDYVKIKALRNGTMSSAANNAPDYPEVRGALGIVNADMHIRSYPVMPGVDDPRWTKNPHGRLGYFAHYAPAAAPVLITQSSTWSSNVLNASLTLRNEHLAPAIYVAAFSLGDKDTGATYITEERHTRLLAPGETQTVWVNFHKLPSWKAAIDAVEVTLTDSYGGIAVGKTGTQVGQFWYSERPPTGSGSSYNLMLGAARPYYISGETVTFNVDHYDGEGEHVNNAKGRFVLFGPNGNEWVNQTIDLPRQKNAVWAYECPNCTTVGNYTAMAWDTTMTKVHQDVVHVSAVKMFTEKRDLHAVAANEVGILSDLVVNFTPTRYAKNSNPEGDIFGDDSNGPGELANELDRYTTIIIGSEVLQTALTPAHTKYAIAEWVQAGGNLIVLGTYTQESRWMEPIYKAAQETANGGISAPDPTHPVLTTPNPLQYQRYLDRARTWRIDADTQFTHVLTRGAGPQGEMDDTLAVSDPGAFNDGTVVLTSYIPGALTEPQDDLEAKRLLHNLLTQSHTMLFMDFGPPISEGVPVGSASRLVAVPHPNVPDAVVEVRLILYLFG